MGEFLFLLFLFGDAVLVRFLYKQHIRSEWERYDRGIGMEPDTKRIRFWYLLIWGVLQVLKYAWLFKGFLGFPAQR